ncbi:hypothetical protein BV898_17366 [Hypsibius exemplaris]|uniref:Uncharacterized protein n=1 Tax=Hypsibius exemplaris TaxID=2072580 RepID=A0A9X6RM29_HYPEX|nr:hypothetical protein BV898_17366 [Hypsibius exemplaris]
MSSAIRETLQIAMDADLVAGNKVNEAFYTTVVTLICRRLKCECNITTTNFNWNASTHDGFNNFFQAVFGGDNPFAIGVSALTMTSERMQTVDFVFPIESDKYGIALFEAALVPIDQAAFFNALFARTSVIKTFIVIALIFVAIALLITCGKLILTSSFGSSHSTKIISVAKGMFGLYAVAFGQDGIATNSATSKSLYGFYSIWFWMVMVIGAVFCSLLPSFLTVATKQLPFTDAPSFRDSGYPLFGGPLPLKMLNDSTDPDRQAIAKAMEVLPFNEMYDCESRERVVGARAAFMTDGGSCSHLHKNCQTSFFAIQNMANIYEATFVTAKRSRHRNTFSRE